MCGIVGIIDSQGGSVDENIVAKMADSLRHRGPDDIGVLTDGSVGLGHTRLSIIDLSDAGHQPMTSANGRFSIVYNGELYNHPELRRELEIRGHNFRSHSDTEILLEYWAAFGERALERFNGMFAFAIFDRHEKRVTLVRDRYGIKPLYYRSTPQTLLFGSEIKSILVHSDVSASLDELALVEYMTFQNLLGSRTLFSGISLLPAGTFMHVDLRTGSTEFSKYWDYSFRETNESIDEHEYAEELDRLFRQAVKRQLVADVDIGTYLSGGIDSGAIATIAAESRPGLKSFTVGFDLSSVSGLELAYDEREQAENLSYHLGTEQYEVILKAGDMERAMRRLVWHLEEPRVGQSYPNFYAAKLASRFGKVVLAGTGGDELFGGYPWRYYRAIINSDFDDYIEKYYAFWQRLLPDAIAQHVFSPIWSRVSDVAPRDLFQSVFIRHADRIPRPEDYVHHSMYFEARTFLHSLLVVEDKLSMAHGLETRVPFLDNDLVDFAMALPARHKLGDLQQIISLNENDTGPKSRRFFTEHRDGKILLRKVLARHVPQRVADALKRGFSGPDASWFRGESLDYVRRLLLGKETMIFEFLNADVLRPLVRDHLEGRENRRLLIWSLLSLEEWCRIFLAKAEPADDVMV